MKIWPVQDAKARFSELLRATLSEGPQAVSLRGVEAAVMVPVEEWRRLTSQDARSLKELLLTDEARGDLLIPDRRAVMPRTSDFG